MKGRMPFLARKNDPELPMYSSISSGYQAAELAHILLAKDINPK